MSGVGGWYPILVEASSEQARVHMVLVRTSYEYVERGDRRRSDER